MRWTMALTLLLTLTAVARSDDIPWAMSPDKKRTARADNREVGIWDAKTDRGLFKIRGHDARVVAIGFSPDSKTLASVDASGRLCLFTVATGKRVQTIDAAKGATELKWGDDGETVVIRTKAGTSVWDVVTGTERR